MPKNTKVNLRVDAEVKTQAAEILEGLGLTLSDAFNILLHQIRISRGLPFEIKYDKSAYVCEYGYLHDYSKKRCEDYEKELIDAKRYTSLEEFWTDINAEDDDEI